MSSLYNFIRTNDVEQIKELLNQGVKPDIYGLGEAILYNHLAIIELFLQSHPTVVSSSENEDIVPFKNLLNYCIIANNKSLFLTLIKTISPDESTFAEAVNKPDMEIISTLINHGIIPQSYHLIQLISNPLCSLEIIKFVLSYITREDGFHIDLEEETYNSIHPSILDYLKEENIRINIIKQENEN